MTKTTQPTTATIRQIPGRAHAWQVIVNGQIAGTVATAVRGRALAAQLGATTVTVRH